MSVNKVLNNIPQSLTSEQKLQARSNIDAAKVVSVYVPGATGWAGDMRFQYDYSTSTYDVSVNNSEIGSILPTPSSSGLYLHTDDNGNVVWADDTYDTEEWASPGLPSTPNAYNLVSGSCYKIRDASEPYTEYMGAITFVAPTSGAFAAVPVLYDSSTYEWSYESSAGSQSCNTHTSVSGVPITIPFRFHKTSYYDFPAGIAVGVGIKGSDANLQLSYSPIVQVQKK